VTLHERLEEDQFYRVNQPFQLSIVKMPATLKEFETVFPKLVDDLKQHCERYKLPKQSLDWFEQVCKRYT
jgi:hypothetical protein